MTDLQVYHSFHAGRLIEALTMIEPHVLDSLVAMDCDEENRKDQVLVERLAVACRIIRGETAVVDSSGAVPDFIGKVGNFLQLFEREDGGDALCQVRGSKMHDELKASLDKVRALYAGRVQAPALEEGHDA